MTLVDGPAAATSRLRRAWDLPVRAHLAGLALVLLALLPVIGTSGGFMPDEGAAVIQARSLARGVGWIVEHPVPEVDPDGRHYPLVLGEVGSRGVAPLGKHPLYPLLLAGAFRMGGFPAMFLLSLAGTVAAAGFAAALARRLDPALGRPAVWAVGLASPLVFDGYLLVAHTLGAAAAAGAVLAAVVAVERRSARTVLAVVPAVAVLLRNEAVLLMAALVVAATAVGLVRRQLVLVAAAAVTAVTAGATYLAERLWISGIVGRDIGAPAPPFRHGGTGFLAGRAEGALITWLTPSQTGSAPVVLALLVMAVAVVLVAARVRLRPGDRRGIVGWAAVAAGAAAVAVVVGPGNIVPGLLFAFPLVVAGLLLLDRRLFTTSAAALTGATAGLFVLAVTATQYRTGGTGEWGGRYFAIGIPVAVPLLLLAILRAGQRLDRRTALRALAGLACCSLAMTTMAVGSHRAEVRSSTALAASVVRVAGAVGDERPVVVTTDDILPRLAWGAFDDVRWLLARSAQVSDLVVGLREAGVHRFALVTATPDRERRLLGGAEVVAAETLDGTALVMLIVDTRA